MSRSIDPKTPTQAPGDRWRTARVLVVLGAYGSGKSEVAVNLALRFRKEHEDVVLVDLDTINPYYRSSDAGNLLHAAGVRTIASRYAGTNVDVPAVPGEVMSVFDGKETAVLDIGGEDMGARVVSSLRVKLAGQAAFVLMVVNLNRPFTSDAEKVAAMASKLSVAAGLPIDAFVDNTNLLGDTGGAMLRDSLPEMREASRRCGIPIAFASGLDDHLPADWTEAMPDGTPLLRMRRTLHYPYENTNGSP